VRVSPRRNQNKNFEYLKYVTPVASIIIKRGSRPHKPECRQLPSWRFGDGLVSYHKLNHVNDEMMIPNGITMQHVHDEYYIA
jgi:hypothetical protein